jgi:ABC-type nitrate/sulfonate/bicarbonate transport system ATPase subunit
MAAKIVVDHVSKYFVQFRGGVFQGFSRRATHALDDVSLTIGDNEFVSIVGPSGCGKTTLLRIIAGLIKPSSGQVVIDGQAVTKPRSGSAMAFQYIGLMPWLTVQENVELALRLRHHRAPSAADADKVRHYLDMVGLSGFEQFHPHQISGGMQQRVGIARALVTEPDVLLMDEPFGALDAQTRLLLQEEFLRLCERYRATVVFITHDVEEAVFLSDRVVALTQRPGQIRSVTNVDIPHPRYEGGARDGERFLELRRKIWEEIRAENVEDRPAERLAS